MAKKPLRFNRGESLEALAEMVKAAFDSGEACVAVECENPYFAERMLSNEIFDDGSGPARLVEAVFAAFEDAGVPLPVGLRVERKAGMPESAPYSAVIVYKKL